MTISPTLRLSQPYDFKLDVRVSMRDGVDLSTDFYLPKSEGPFPTLLVRTIYDNQRLDLVDWAGRFVEAGYAVVMQDCRGRFDSDGAWEPYVHEAEDGYDTQEWIGAQPWCDGNIGTFGISYVGFTQTLPATLGSRFLKAIAPTASQQDNFGHFYIDGALQLHVAMNFLNMAGRTMQTTTRNTMNHEEYYRRLPLVSALDDFVDLPFYREVIRHYTFDDFWKSYSLRYRYEDAAVPAYFITGWYDNLVHEGFKQYQAWKTKPKSPDVRRLTRLLVGGWSHSNLGTSEQFGTIGFGQGAGLDIVDEQVRWYDRRLKGIENGIDDEPPILLFTMGSNEWQSLSDWPPANAEYTSYFLHGRGGSNSLSGTGALSTEPPQDEPPDRYSYDPEDPAPTLGGQIMAIQNTVSGPWDRRPVERRDDVLVYTATPLERDVEVTGPIELTLYASSSAADTDFTGTLVDVHPDGNAIIICEGLLRARFRDSIEEPTPIEPGKVYEFRVDMWETSNVFKAGHCIRLEVSSSNFPRFDRNLNTGNRPGMDTEMRVAYQTIYHDSERRSHLTLPIIPR